MVCVPNYQYLVYHYLSEGVVVMVGPMQLRKTAHKSCWSLGERGSTQRSDDAAVAPSVAWW